MKKSASELGMGRFVASGASVEAVAERLFRGVAHEHDGVRPRNIVFSGDIAEWGIQKPGVRAAWMKLARRVRKHWLQVVASGAASGRKRR